MYVAECYVHHMNYEDYKLTPMALKELLVAAATCIEYRKDEVLWKSSGLLGFPATILLLSFVDSVGFLLKIKGTADDKGNRSVAGKSFEIVRDPHFFNPPLTITEKKKLYELFRGYLTHQASLADGTSLSWSKFPREKVIEKTDSNNWSLNIEVLYEACSRLYRNHESEIRSKSK